MELDSIFSNLSLGFSVALSLKNLFWCLMGAIIGTAIGVLPGVGPVATMALLLPVTYFLTPEGALIMLAGIYYGAQYGGSTTAILVNLPGEASSVVTALDGYAMAKQGRAGPALAIAALGSFFAGTVATFLIVLAAPPLTKVAQQFAPADYFSLMILGLVLAVVMASGSVLKALCMIFLGMLLGLVGTDVNTGNTRYTFGIGDLFDGIGFVIVAMGIFGMAEIIQNLADTERRDLVSSKIDGLMPTRKDLAESALPILRGTILGSLLGILPGGGAVLASFVSYSVEKKLSATPELFGKGMIAGVAGPESANNAAAQTSFIPDVDLGDSLQRRHGDDGGRHDDPRHRSGTAGDGTEPRPVLGHDRVHVARQFDVAGAEPAADRHLGEDADGSLSAPRHRHHVLLLHRCVQPEQPLDRSLDDGVLRHAWVRLPQIRLRARAAAAGLPARPAHGSLHAPRHAVVARRSVDLRGTPPLPDVSRHLRSGVTISRPAKYQVGSTRGVPGVAGRS